MVDTAGFEKAGKAWEQLKATIATWPAAMREAFEKVSALFEKLSEDGKKAQDNLVPNEKIQHAIEDLAFKTRILNQEFSGLAKGFPELAKGVVPLEQIKTSVTALGPALQELNAAQLQFNAAQITQDNLLPWQQYEQQILRINQAFENGQKNPEIYALAMKKAAETTGQAWDLAASKMVGDLATGLKAFAAQNKSLAGVAKAAAIAQALINTYTAASKALATYPPPLSYVAAGAAIVAGLGYVAQI
jgi:hypothetical protein